MEEILKKLNYKNHQKIVISGVPTEHSYFYNFPVKTKVLDFELKTGNQYDFILLFLGNCFVITKLPTLSGHIITYITVIFSQNTVFSIFE